MDRSLVTILVIDESVMVRRVLETLLERDGFSSVHSLLAQHLTPLPGIH